VLGEQNGFGIPGRAAILRGLRRVPKRNGQYRELRQGAVID